MKLRCVAAAEADPRDYIEGANRAFGGWGDEALFAWAFRDADVLFAEDEGRIVGGAGIVPRRTKRGERFAIMSGAWTAPEARGRGVFSRMVEEICAVARGRGGTFLGFVRMENASSRVLRAMGAALHPAYYCRSTVSDAPIAEWRAIDPVPDRFPSTFDYTPEAWRVQFLERPHARIECIGTDDGAAIVETMEEFDRVHAVSDEQLLPALADRAHARGRRLFWYATTRPRIACDWTEGYVGTLPPLAMEWSLQNGDRM